MPSNRVKSTYPGTPYEKSKDQARFRKYKENRRAGTGALPPLPPVKTGAGRTRHTEAKPYSPGKLKKERRVRTGPN